MGEIKSVKVDNWGVFFLQKLQNFFNKTDYCDLTLQFRDNSQLKVHRLVLSACTDYFNVLEQTCDVVDDALLMPDELQADVVVPIVNFMYTGTLEFELKMYGKLLRTAKEMNMTVLLKLLEAHRRTMEGVNRAQRPPSPKPIRRRPITGVSVTSPQLAQQQQRRVLTSANVTQTPQQRVAVQTKSIATNLTQQSVPYRQQIGSTSLLRTSAGGTPIIRSQYGTTSIYSTSNQQQQAKHDDQHSSSVKQQQQPTSPFEQLRKGYNNNKRPAPTTFVSPPTKKPNIEDVKEFAEQQRMRKQIAAEYGEDPEYEGMLDDDIHNDDDDDDGALASSSASAAASTSKQSPSTQGGTTVTFRQELNDKPPTIVVKDSSNSKMNHAKIISEVLRQYPHLVKGNKNIKLKIMPNVGGQSQKIIVKKESIDSNDAGGGQQQNLPGTKLQTSARPVDKVIIQKTTQQQTPTVAKDVVSTPKATSSAVLGTSASSAAKTSGDNAASVPAQKRRIDSKTMHALISLGAENTTGPWLCLRCGVNGRPISIPSYRGFRRHLINTHKESIDPALCEHCGWRSNTNRELHFHMQLEHKVRTTLYTFPECLMCAELFLDTNALNQHMIDSHPDESKQKCIYCNKIFAKEIQLYTHMKTFHKKQALDDGIIDYSDDEFIGSQDEIDEIQNTSGSTDKKEGKVKILSDISLPSATTLLKLEPSSEAAALSTVASGIAASIGISHAEEFIETQTQDGEAGTEPKFVNADGNEMLLTEEQRKEIMSQLNDGEGGNASGGVLMVINETSFGSATESGAAVDGNVTTAATVLAGNEESETADNQTENTTTGECSATEEEYDDSQIFNELTSQTNASITEEEEDEDEEEAQAVDKKNASPAIDDSKESIDENLEWAEKLISAHEKAESAAEADEQKVAEDKAKKADDINKKLKELTGDWSDDENEDDMEAEVEAENSFDAEASAEMDVNTEDNAIKTCIQYNEELTTTGKSNTEAVKSEDESSDVVAQKPVSTKEPSIDEDDIDIAMQSLHKDEIDTEKSVATKSDKVATEKNESDSAATNTNKTEVKEETKEEEQVHILPHEIKEEKESPKRAKDKQERNDARPSLLDDLIADADLSRVDEDEFISVKSEVTSPERKPTNAAIQKAKEPINEDTVTEKELVATGDEELTLQNVETKSNTVEEENKEHCVDDEDNESGDKKETDKKANADTDTDTEKTANAEDVKVQNPNPNPNAPTEATKTEDKVKSLISEWGDDEEDDGEGNENIAGDDTDEL